jgi:uncharacterized protein
MPIEYRSSAISDTRRSANMRTLVGYAAMFDVDADIGGQFLERIQRGAFAGSLKSDVRALVNHDSGRVIGRTTNGSLRLAEDSKGLRVEVDLPDTSDGADLWRSVQRGDISGMSFGFFVTRQEWDDTRDPPRRTLQAVELFEVSACPFPAYTQTSLTARSDDTASVRNRLRNRLLRRELGLAMARRLSRNSPCLLGAGL